MKRAAAMNRLILIKFFLPFFIILCLSLIAGIVVYERTSALLENEVKIANQHLLEQGMNVLDQRWRAIETFARKLDDDTNLTRLQLISNPYASNNLYRIIETHNLLQENYNSNELMMDYFVLFKKSGLVLNGNLISNIKELPQNLNYVNEKSDFFNSLLSTYHYHDTLPAATVLYNGTPHSVVTYLQSFGFSNYSNACILVLIDNNEIMKLFDGLKINGGWAYIADEHGNVITSVQGPNSSPAIQKIALPEKNGVMLKKIGRQEMIITYVTSKYNGWTYVAAQPSNIVLEKINYLKKMIVFIFMALLTLGAIIALFVAYRNSRPLQAIIQTLSSFPIEPPNNSRNTFRMIHHIVSTLIDSNHELQEKMAQQLPFLRAAFFERLLRGYFHSEQELVAVMQNVKVKLDGVSYLAAILSFPGNSREFSYQEIEQFNQKKIMVREMTSEWFENGFYLHDVAEDKIALIMTFSSADKETVYREVGSKLLELQQHLSTKYGLITLISIGDVYPRRNEIFKSFIEAQQAMVKSHDACMVWFKDFKQNDKRYFYPENMEVRLIHLIRTGNTDALKLLLEEIYEQNFTGNNLPALILKVFLFDFLGSILKVSEEIEGLNGYELALMIDPGVDATDSILDSRNNITR